ncbi:MAG: hypothetical protein JWN78_3384 [Bacteroidota bacterium]|nr:hypothetical protein [Bacteroidota bacterium]
MLKEKSYSSIESKHLGAVIHRASVDDTTSLRDILNYISEHEPDILRLNIPATQRQIIDEIQHLSFPSQFLYCILRYKYNCDIVQPYMGAVTFRRAMDFTDVKKILYDAFIDQTQVYMHSSFINRRITHEMEMNALLEYYENYMQSENKNIYLCCEEDRPFGCFSEEKINDDTVINSIFGMYREYQAKGLYIECLKKYIHENNLKKVRTMLIGVRADNYPARKVYDKLNFQHYDTEFVFLLFPKKKRIIEM